MTRCQVPDWSGIISKAHNGLYNRNVGCGMWRHWGARRGAPSLARRLGTVSPYKATCSRHNARDRLLFSSQRLTVSYRLPASRLYSAVTLHNTAPSKQFQGPPVSPNHLINSHKPWHTFDITVWWPCSPERLEIWVPACHFTTRTGKSLFKFHS